MIDVNAGSRTLLAVYFHSLLLLFSLDSTLVSTLSTLAEERRDGTGAREIRGSEEGIRVRRNVAAPLVNVTW